MKEARLEEGNTYELPVAGNAWQRFFSTGDFDIGGVEKSNTSAIILEEN